MVDLGVVVVGVWELVLYRVYVCVTMIQNIKVKVFALWIFGNPCTHGYTHGHNLCVWIWPCAQHIDVQKCTCARTEMYVRVAMSCARILYTKQVPRKDDR